MRKSNMSRNRYGGREAVVKVECVDCVSGLPHFVGQIQRNPRYRDALPMGKSRSWKKSGRLWWKVRNRNRGIRAPLFTGRAAANGCCCAKGLSLLVSTSDGILVGSIAHSGAAGWPKIVIWIPVPIKRAKAFACCMAIPRARRLRAIACRGGPVLPWTPSSPVPAGRKMKIPSMQQDPNDAFKLVEIKTECTEPVSGTHGYRHH